ncbi:MAG: DUF2029 domain-containing protein [Ktedonobacteraceae bacterium]|nr:DUF2029 domain-containing protein [Ktedonobacteraceae bacterium]
MALLLNALLRVDGIAAYIPITLVTISIFIGSSWQIFLPTPDPARYQCYALTFWFGSNAIHMLPATQCAFLQKMMPSVQPPFHMLPMEYPPLTLLPFSLALLVPLPYYQLAIAFIMALAAVFIYWLLLQYGPRGAALAFALSLFVGALGTAQMRFDLLPAALTLICVIAAERKHWTSAYVALAFGVLLKIYPILLLPALFLAEQRLLRRLPVPPQELSLRSLPRQLWNTLRTAKQWYWNNMLLCLGLILGVTCIFALLNFQGAVITQITYFLERPVQVEAMGGSLLWLAQGLGFPLTISESYGSLNIVSPLAGIVSSLETICMIVGYLYVVIMQWRGKFDITQATLAILLVSIITGKVFSPQYLIWLMPLLAYAGAFDAFWNVCWGLVCALTTYTLIFLYTKPVSDIRDIPLLPGFFETLGIRNAFFVLITLAYLFNWFQARQRRPLPFVPGGKVTRPLKEFLVFQKEQPETGA